MPELPEVAVVAEALDSALRGRTFTAVRFISRMRQPFDEKAVSRALRGATCVGIRRRAKYILMEFDREAGLMAHLGMTGRFRIEEAATPGHAHDRVAFHLDDGRVLRYADARRFGFVSLVRYPGPGQDPVELAALGWEPLERQFTAGRIAGRAQGRGCPVKNFIMDQAIVVGIGNIYANEALFMARIDPRRAVATVTLEEWKRLVTAIKAVLRAALRAGGSTIRNYRTVDGAEGHFQRKLHIYGKAGEQCPLCRNPVETVRLGGRSTFFCPTCQR